MKTKTLALAAALAAGGLAYAQDADCNVNGIPDATEIAQGLVDDCNVNGIPDVCEYAGVMLEAAQSGFGNGSPLIATFTDVEPSISDVRLAIEVRADLDSVGEFVQVKVGGSVVATLWVTGGLACTGEPQSQTVIIPPATFNASIASGAIVISLEPSGLVSVKECPTAFASMAVEFVSEALPADCLGNGTWDGCALAADPSLDCDGNGLIDSCEIDDDPSLDCDASGSLDQCQLSVDPSLDCDGNQYLDSCDPDCDYDGTPDACAILYGTVPDCNSNGIPDTCEVIPGYFVADCDGDGVPDDCQIAADPVLDKNADRILDTCQIARGDFDLDRVVGGADLALMLSVWGNPDAEIADLTGDSRVDGADLTYLLGNWGTYSAPWGLVLEHAPNPAVIRDTALRAELLSTGLPWRVRHYASNIEMLLVPPGSFLMGCSPSLQSECRSQELPVHQVVLTQSRYVGRYEVTQQQWAAVMGSNPSEFAGFPDSPLRPVEKVTWHMAKSFVNATGLRLLTEAEWEYACRAGSVTAFNNESDDAEDLPEVGWFTANSEGHTRPVGSLRPNAFGIHDMHGNVQEWANDQFNAVYYQYSPLFDPPGAGSECDWCPSRVIRGGSIRTASDQCRSSYRNGFVPHYNGSAAPGINPLGFRVARTP